MNLTEDDFWKLILQAKTESSTPMERPDRVAEALRSMPPASIQHFSELFSEMLDRSYNWDLWAIAYIANGGCSDDGFEYFRAWLISEGREVFERALQDPQSLIDVIDPTFGSELESMLGVAHRVYFDEVGEPIARQRRSRREPTGKPWEDKDLSQRFPRACQKFDW